MCSVGLVFVIEKCFQLNAAKKFLGILLACELVSFFGYRNEVKAFAKNRFSASESGRFSGIVTSAFWFWRSAALF